MFSLVVPVHLVGGSLPVSIEGQVTSVWDVSVSGGVVVIRALLHRHQVSSMAPGWLLSALPHLETPLLGSLVDRFSGSLGYAHIPALQRRRDIAFGCGLRSVASGICAHTTGGGWWQGSQLTCGFAKLRVDSINHLEQRFRGGQNYRAWSHGHWVVFFFLFCVV
ncbi:hypothetical protein Bca4012_084284 [Brassica carinata]|uniref:Uncharacterized protein n=1 Tax=Brassica carinata TaxID=52824 RepID=A0A8X7SGR8_BRACI|nr:hypothetical protein Bca52824_026487 [Brassica carinata]